MVVLSLGLGLGLGDCVWCVLLPKLVANATISSKTTPRVIRKRKTCFQTPCNLVFNIILRYFRDDITPYSAVNKCYRRS